MQSSRGRGGRTGNLGRGAGRGQQTGTAAAVTGGVTETDGSASGAGISGGTEQTASLASVTAQNFTPAQMHKILSLIEEPSNGERLTGNRDQAWLIDSGASTHMTGNSNNLIDVETISPVIVDLPNGVKTVADKHGTAVLENTLKLHNTLLVPSLSCNLISVSRICKDLKCTVIFNESSCILQGRTSRIPIGLGEQRDGVYFYQAGKERRQVHAVQIGHLWHQRLGHPSKEVMALFFNSIHCPNMSKKNNEVCEICFRAKQTRNSFPLSTNIAKDLFDVIIVIFGDHIEPLLGVEHIIFSP